MVALAVLLTPQPNAVDKSDPKTNKCPGPQYHERNEVFVAFSRDGERHRSIPALSDPSTLALTTASPVVHRVPLEPTASAADPAATPE